jgi:hypothetical protein
MIFNEVIPISIPISISQLSTNKMIHLRPTDDVTKPPPGLDCRILKQSTTFVNTTLTILLFLTVELVSVDQKKCKF